MTIFTITAGHQGLEFLNANGRTVARIINEGMRGRWFATPAAYIDGVLRNTNPTHRVDVTRMRNQHGGGALVAQALGL